MLTYESQICDVIHEILPVPNSEKYFVKTIVDGELFSAAVCATKSALADYLACFDEDSDEVSHV